MIDFYRFPVMAKISEWDFTQQITKLEEEVKEVSSAYLHEGDSNIATGIELMDIIHAAETGLRMLFTDEEVYHLRALAELKNKKRNYYGDQS